MDLTEATVELLKRIKELDPQNACKVVGHVLLQNVGVLEMIRLAHAPTRVLESLIAEVVGKLGSSQESNPLVVSNLLPEFPIPFEASSSGMQHNQLPDVLNGPFHPAHDQLGSLEHIGMELVELLRCRGGLPVSISSIPKLYYDKYETLFPLEHRNKEELVCWMEQVVAQMEKTSILMVNRPREGESIVLAEDFNNLNKPNEICMSFRQQSRFTEEDVRNYFENFGPVREVNIPYQEERTFGFVTFDYPETAALVLAKNNPHYILGSRVKVKPCRLKLP